MASSARSSGISLYRQVDSILREQIADGVLRPGDRLPSEDALCGEYGISRGTVRQALDALGRDGLIDRAPGRGTFVRAGARKSGDERARHGWRALAIDGALRATKLTREGSAPPPAVVAKALAIGDSAETPFFIRFAPARGGGALGLKRYIHPRFTHVAAGLAAAVDFPIAMREAAGGAVTQSGGWLEAILAEPRFATLLKVPHGSPLVSLWWVDAVDGAPAACSQMLLPGRAAAIELD